MPIDHPEFLNARELAEWGALKDRLGEEAFESLVRSELARLNQPRREMAPIIENVTEARSAFIKLHIAGGEKP